MGGLPRSPLREWFPQGEEDLVNIETIFGENGTYSRGCPVCGDPVAVTIQLRIFESERGVNKKGGRNKTISRSFCADHAAPLWVEVAAVMQRKPIATEA